MSTENQNPTKKVTTTTTTTVTTVTEEIVEKKLVETHYLLILDKSGSMESVRNETINNFNEQIQTIKNLEKEFPDQKYFVSLVTFNDNTQTIIKDVPASDVKELTRETYIPNGSTALLHAMGEGITSLQDKLTPSMSNSSEKIVSAVVVVMTDGGENHSHYLPANWTNKRVKELVEKLNKDQRWTINFLGANQDSFLTGKEYGIAAGNTLNYVSTQAGTRGVADVLKKSMRARATDINAGYSSLVGGSGSDNAVYFSSVVDNSKTIENESIDYKQTKSDAQELKTTDSKA